MQFVTPMPFQEAINKLGDQTPIGAALSSSEWSDVPVALRDNAFFSANVESLRFLQRAQDSLGDFLAGNVKTLDDGQTLLATGGRAAFIDQMQKFLLGEGVVRSDGGLTDITSGRRLGLIFDTKVQQAGDFGYWRQGLDPDVLNEFPAMRFIRVKDVREPRQSHERYQDQVYLKTDPIWALVINQDFGVPWGPWGWGCGHDVEDVDRDEAEKLGLIKPGERLSPAPLLQKYNFNSNLSASTLGVEPELLAKMKKVFGDQIIIEGDTMRWRESAAEIPRPENPDRTSPVSAALNLRVSGSLKVEVNTAVAAIDQVHDDGDLPEIPVLSSRKSSLGFLRSTFTSDGQTATQIGVRATGQWPALTMAHEAGHLLDLEAIGENGSFATAAGDAEMKKVLAAANDTESIRALRDKLNNVESMETRRGLRYLLKPEEIWARAYAQFITEQSGSPLLVRQLAAAIKMDALRQWSPEDFKPVSDAIKTMFQNLGWL
jgi:hypothetical protein